MKTTKRILALMILALGFVFQSCQKDELDNQKPENIIPEKFKVEIPSALLAQQTKSTKVDTIQGNAVYQHLRLFIRVGDHAAEIVSDIMKVIRQHNLSQAMEFTFTSDEDGRLKKVVIVENASFENQTWQFKMTITDVDTDEAAKIESNIAMQIFWNNSPVKGIALLNPWNIDRLSNVAYKDAMYRIDYSEAGEMAYEQHMIVSLTGLPMGNPLDEPYAMSTLKMFAGRNGDVVSLFGNSEHPNAKFFTGETGFNWAFTAAAITSANIAVAEVGLPSNTLDSDNRYTLLVENSIKNVFSAQILSVWPFIDEETLNAYLYNTQAPGFFNQNGFVQAGTAPHSGYNSMLNIIAALKPYNPAAIHQLTISFDE